MLCFIHPTTFGFNFCENAICLLFKFGRINRRIVVGSDKSRSRGKVIQNGFSCSELGDWFRHAEFAIWIKDIAFSIDFISQRTNLLNIAAHLSRDTGHAGSAKTIKNDISWLRIVEDVTHDRPVWHLGMIAMGFVDWVVLSLRNIRGKWLADIVEKIILGRFLPFPLLNEVVNPRIRAGAVIWRIAQSQNIFIFSNREAFDLPELRVFQLFSELFSKILPPCLIIGKLHSQADDRRISIRDQRLGEEFPAPRFPVHILRFEKLIRHGYSPFVSEDGLSWFEEESLSFVSSRSKRSL